MRTALVATLSGLLAASPALGSQERILSPKKVVLTAEAGKPFGEVTAEVTTRGGKKDLRFGSVRLRVGGEWHQVPKKALVDLSFGMLQKVELRTERGFGDAPWLYVYTEIAARADAGRWVTRKVHFAYHKGRFEHRSLTTPRGEGKTKWDKLDL